MCFFTKAALGRRWDVSPYATAYRISSYKSLGYVIQTTNNEHQRHIFRTYSLWRGSAALCILMNINSLSSALDYYLNNVKFISALWPVLIEPDGSPNLEESIW